LQSRRDIDNIAMQVGAIGNGVAGIDADAEPDAALRWSVAITLGNSLLDLHGTAYCPNNAIEHDEKRIAGSANDPSAMLGDCRVYHIASQCSQALQRARIIEADEAAVAHDVSMQHSY
jgi:hypothetical protein